MRHVTTAEMRQIDELAIREYGIPSLLLMENAALGCVAEILKLLDGKFRRVAIFCGKGNNGGDGFAIARHLHNRGLKVSIFFFQNPAEMKPDPLTNFRILEKMKVNLINCSFHPDWDSIGETLKKSNVIVDALFGTGLSKPIDEPFSTAVALMNESDKPVLSVDIPSGLNADTGEVMGTCVRATVTVALGLPKKGFYLNQAERWTGKVAVADISIPKALLENQVKTQNAKVKSTSKK